MAGRRDGRGRRARPRLLPLVLLLSLPPARVAATGPDAAREPRLPTVFADEPARRAEVQAALPAALDAVERELGAIDWSGTRIAVVAGAGDRARSGVPEWAAAYARPGRGEVVLRLDRIGGYPFGSLGQVLTHELAHVALARRAGAGALPRWFDEGLAMRIAREPGVEDALRLSTALLLGADADRDELERRFHAGAEGARSAYVLARSLVAHLEERGGPGSLRRVVDLVAAGSDLDAAVRAATGLPLDRLEAEWRREAVLLYRWLPLVTSGTALWVGTALLALVAWRRARDRRREQEARWELEEAAAAEEAAAP